MSVWLTCSLIHTSVIFCFWLRFFRIFMLDLSSIKSLCYKWLWNNCRIIINAQWWRTSSIRTLGPVTAQPLMLTFTSTWSENLETWATDSYCDQTAASSSRTDRFYHICLLLLRVIHCVHKNKAREFLPQLGLMKLL